MAHCEKYPKAAVTGMFIHYERTAGHNLSNKDIDSSRSHLNYNVAETDQSLSQNLFLSQRLSEIKTNNRNNQNVICDWIVTQPKDVRSEDSHAFFLAVYEFLSNRYGKKNVVSAYVHMDEIGQTPHMHFCFVPVQTLEDGSEKLNAKAIVDKNELRTFHPALQKAVDQSLGYHVSIQNGITREQGGNKTVKQLKEETALKEQLPKGKKKVLSSDLSYTAEESAELHALAEDGISYRVEKKSFIERQKLQEMREKLYSGRLEELKKQKADLSDLIEQAESTAAMLGAPDAKSYMTVHQENTQLQNRVDVLEDSILTIAENVGTEIMQEIPLKKIDIYCSTLPAKPSGNVMRVIRKYVDEALNTLQDKIETIKERLWNAFDRITELLGRSGNPEIRRLNESFEEAMSDLSDQQLFSARKLLSDEPKKRRFEQHHR